ncbi:MAG: serine hydrolase [Verrucomicrobiota bacterium]|nr:serine hydrolase [Verrucomicrobiota bacterium]
MRLSVRFAPRFRVFFCTLVLALIGGRTAGAARAFAVVDSQTGFVLAEQDSKAKRQVGSLTKIATAMVVLDWAEHKGGNLAQTATVPPEAFVGTGENNVGFQPGDTIALRDLLYAALIQSDNVAAYTLAAHVGQALQSGGAAPVANAGSVALFVGQMNALAKQLNMQRTRFLNPHGIDASEQPFSSALDMARLTRYAMNKAAFRFYVSQKERQITFESGGKKRGYLLRNTNELLGTNGVDGVKTGTTARAGECLILSSHREAEVKQEGTTTYVTPRHLIIVVLGSADRFGEGAQLLARGWQLYDQWAATGRVVDPKRTL